MGVAEAADDRHTKKDVLLKQRRPLQQMTSPSHQPMLTGSKIIANAPMARMPTLQASAASAAFKASSITMPPM
jgi:hypothetical protein